MEAPTLICQLCEGYGKLANFTSWGVLCSCCHCIVILVAMTAKIAASAVTEAI